MQPDLTEKLYAAFQQLYRGRYKPQSESAMCWGFECGDGWYQVLYDLSQDLHNYQVEHPTLNIEVVQVKSKFGILRVHLNYRDAITEKLIELAQQRAGATCEQTGMAYFGTDDFDVDVDFELVRDGPLYESDLHEGLRHE